MREKVFLFNGTDEAGAELLIHAIYPEGCKTDILWLGPQTDFVASYEDRPFAENVAGHLRALSIEVSADSANLLCILPPKAKQGESYIPRTAPCQDYTDDEMQAMCSRIAQANQNGKRCYLLDVDFGNGGNTRFLELLGQTMPILSLWGYSGWNTACNSLGTILAQMLVTPNANCSLNHSFTAERILDDAIYQPLVRSRVTERMQELGLDIYHIQDVAQAENFLAETYFENLPTLERIFGGNVPEFAPRLRWPRLFEVAVFTKDSTGPIFQ